MDVRTFQYTQSGWSVDKFPELDSEQTLVLVFSSPEFIKNQRPIKELAQFYQQAKMIGCSTAGEIFGASVFDNSLSVAVIKFAHTRLATAVARVDKASESRQAGENITRQLLKDDIKNIFVLSDGIGINGSELVKGLNSHSRSDLVITGGLAGDGSKFVNSWIIVDGEVIDNYVAAIGFYGHNLHIGHASRGGWDIFGPSRRITRSAGNILYELDNQPALWLYKEYLGERAAELPASGLLYPLAIHDNNPNNHVQLVRTILGVDEENQSLIFAGDMPEGYHAQLMRANFDRLITSANEAAESSYRSLPLEGQHNEPVLAIAVSCVGRRLLLGERTEEETESTLSALPPHSHLVGFYSYGEISPFTVGNCELHNQTMTLTTFYEK